jgi:hypothetical protein
MLELVDVLTRKLPQRLSRAFSHPARYAVFTRSREQKPPSTTPAAATHHMRKIVAKIASINGAKLPARLKLTYLSFPQVRELRTSTRPT